MNAISSFEQEAVSKPEKTFVLKGRTFTPSDLVFFGSLVLFAHLVLQLANRWVSDQTIGAYIPKELNPNPAFQFALSTIVGLLLEIVLFFIGWLWVSGMVVLLNGRENVRALFGALGLCYLPAMLISAGAYIRLLMGVTNFNSDAIAHATTPEQLAAAFQQCEASGFFHLMKIGSNIGYLLLLAGALESVHRICGISRLKSALILGSYVGFLFALNHFAK